MAFILVTGQFCFCLEFSQFGVGFLFCFRSVLHNSNPPNNKGVFLFLCDWEWQAMRRCGLGFFSGAGESVGELRISGYLTRGSY